MSNRDLLIQKCWAYSLLYDLSKIGINECLMNGTKASFEDFCYYNHNKLCSEGIYYSSGETKIVFWDDNYTFVLKLPFLNDNYSNKPRFDYCRAEWRNYLMAKSQKLDSHFASISYVGLYLGYPAYVMEYVDVDEELTADIIKSYTNVSNFSNEDGVLELGAIRWEDYDELIDFLEENHINDIHTGNVGWRGEELVIIDYSGYGMNVTNLRFKKDWWKILEVQDDIFGR